MRVLRLKEGDQMVLMDGVGTFYRAEVVMATAKRCEYIITATMAQQPQWHGHIHLAMAPTKMMERVEWLAEKATEIGLNELSFLDCQYSERRHLRTDRVEKIVVAAMNQSRHAWKPIVNDLRRYTDFINEERHGRKYICHCYDEIERHDLMDLLAAPDDSAPDDDVTILIGPEGDFSIDEVRMAIDNGYESVTLGNARLRTETAALFAVMGIQINRRK